MSRVQVYDDADNLSLAVPSGTAAGTPVCVGQIPGWAETDRDADGESTVRMRGAARLSVKGMTNSAANVAVAVGDILYFTVGATPKLNKDTTGIRYGYALEPVLSGSTTAILVKVGY